LVFQLKLSESAQITATLRSVVDTSTAATVMGKIEGVDLTA